jgi:hypothetical protein
MGMALTWDGEKNAEPAFAKSSCFYSYAVIGHNLGF